jgi:hypothetical protein
MADTPLSPIRLLYAKLCELLPPEEIDENLLTVPDYQHMRGTREMRFYEWAYERLEQRTLIDGLLGTVLRPADARRFAERVGCPPIKGVQEAKVILREALHRLGVNEPQLPPRLIDGVETLRDACDWLDQSLSSEENQPEPISDLLGPDGACRRAAERMVKVLAVFLWRTELQSDIRRIIRKKLHGFRPPAGVTRDLEEWLMKKSELGSLNYLLRALNEYIKENHLSPPFVRSPEEIWGNPAFQRLNAVAEALQNVAHDTLFRDEERRRKLFRALEGILRLVDEGISILLPRTIQFFRRYEDGHATHYQGYDPAGSLVRCFECWPSYHLHVPYLYLAPTNPSVVGIVCTDLPMDFTRPI